METSYKNGDIKIGDYLSVKDKVNTYFVRVVNVFFNSVHCEVIQRVDVIRAHKENNDINGTIIEIPYDDILHKYKIPTGYFSIGYHVSKINPNNDAIGIDLNTGKEIYPKCECGAHKLGYQKGPAHSTWCELYRKEII